MRIRTIRRVFGRTGGVSVLGMALAAAGCIAALRTGPAYSQPAPGDASAGAVAENLDAIVQPRFQEEMRNFGLSRVLPAAGGHLIFGNLTTPSQRDRDLLKAAQASRRDFAVGFVHCVHAPGRPQTKAGLGDRGRVFPGRPNAATAGSIGYEDGALPIYDYLNHLVREQGAAAAQEETALHRRMAGAVRKSLARLMKGHGEKVNDGDWLVVMRPIRAQKSGCLNCHTGARPGDTLGIMAYAVSRSAFPQSAGATSRAAKARGGAF